MGGLFRCPGSQVVVSDCSPQAVCIRSELLLRHHRCVAVACFLPPSTQPTTPFSALQPVPLYLHSYFRSQSALDPGRISFTGFVPLIPPLSCYYRWELVTLTLLLRAETASDLPTCPPRFRHRRICQRPLRRETLPTYHDQPLGLIHPWIIREMW